MKKILLSVTALALSLGLAACSSNNNAETDKQDNKQTDTSKADVKKELVTVYMDLGNKINGKDADLNAYVKKASNPDTKPTADDRAKASQSAAAVAAELNSYQVPADLKDQKADLEKVIKEYANSYQMQADELKKASPNLDAANAVFTKADQQLGKIFESAKMLAPSLAKQVNQ